MEPQTKRRESSKTSQHFNFLEEQPVAESPSNRRPIPRFLGFLHLLFSTPHIPNANHLEPRCRKAVSPETLRSSYSPAGSDGGWAGGLTPFFRAGQEEGGSHPQQPLSAGCPALSTHLGDGPTQFDPGRALGTTRRESASTPEPR